MSSYLFGSLALWVLTHVITHELPSKKWPKPWSCPVCFSGWACIASAGYMILARGWDPGLAMMIAGAFWAAVLFLEAAYWRLVTIVM